jgi:hypothetical protein
MMTILDVPTVFRTTSAGSGCATRGATKGTTRCGKLYRQAVHVDQTVLTMMYSRKSAPLGQGNAKEGTPKGEAVVQEVALPCPSVGSIGAGAATEGEAEEREE